MLRVESIDIGGDPAIGHAEPCVACGGTGFDSSRRKNWFCPHCEVCDGVGFFGIDPRPGTTAQPGSNEKIAVLAARCRAGLPLIHEDDDAGRASETSRKESPEWMLDDAP